MPMAQRQGRECADCLGNRRLERRLSLRRAEKHAFHGRGKLLLIGVMQQQKLQWGPLCPRPSCFVKFVKLHARRGDRPP